MPSIKLRHIHKFIIIVAVLLTGSVGISMVKAKAPTGYPVPGLDNCQNKEECRKACLSKYPTQCVYYHPELTTELLREIRGVLNEAAEVYAREGGPGGCSTEDQCVKYCQIPGRPGEGVIPECYNYYIGGPGGLWWYNNINITNLAPLWDRMIPAIITAMDKNIEPPAECRTTYANDHLTCVTGCASPTNDDGEERSESCTNFITKTGYFSKDDLELDAKLRELAKQGEKGGCAYSLFDCFDVTGFYAPCAQAEDPVACFALADKYDLIPKKDTELGKKVAPLLKDDQTPGKCTDIIECRDYCSIQANYDECTKFAVKNNLVVEIPDDKKAIFDAMQKGESPGQCKDEVSCRNYCENIDNIGECADFVEKFKLASDDELKEMRQIAEVKRAGVSFPGNCKTKESCLKYCDNSANAVVCMEFALKAGFIPKEDVEAVGKILPYLKSGGKLPGGCTTKESCDTYCGSDTHVNECVDFAVGAGFMNKEEADIVKKVGGKGPGNCKSREACDSYCKDETHTDECIDFAVKAGFVSQEDAEMAKKFGITSGPGNCKSKAECEAFCVLPENQETCFNFAKDHGMLSEQDLKNAEEQEKFLESLDKASPERLACLEKELGPEFFGRFKAGKLTQSEAKSLALETAQRTCEPDIRKETEACLALSCSEFEACLKSLEQVGGEQGGEQQQQAQGTPDPKVTAKAQACQQEKINACLAKSCGEFQACINSLGGGGEQQGGTPDPAVIAKVKSCQPPPPSGDSGEQQQQQGGDQSQIPQGFSSWEAFCRANPGDSRCSAYMPQIPQYPLFLRHSLSAAILNFLLGARK